MAVREFLGKADRLRHMRWFNTVPTVTSMSVAEHSYYTALIALLIARTLPDFPLKDGKREEVDEAGLLRRCLIQELEESETGDVNTMVKQDHSDFVMELKVVQYESMQKILSSLPFKLIDGFQSDWNIAKQDGLTGQIVKAADLLSMLLYAEGELSMGNVNIMPVITNIQGLLVKVDVPWLGQWMKENWL